MDKQEFNGGMVLKYLLFTFLTAYGLQLAAWRFYETGLTFIGQIVIALMMFIPMLGVLVAGGSLKLLGWKVRLRRNIRVLVIALTIPISVTICGAGLYFLRHLEHFDLSGGYLTAIAGQQAMEQLAAQGLDFRTYALITCISAITYAPFLNSMLALGEETGWRGFLYPQLKAKFGRIGGNVLGGIIWGAWHWPLIALIGYEYGAAAGNRAGYAGFPYSGMALFCLFTVAAGIIHDWLYETSRSIWYPALFHGAINAQLTLPLLFCKPDTGSYRLLGPAGNGLVSMLPLLVIAALLLVAGDHMMSDLED